MQMYVVPEKAIMLQKRDPASQTKGWFIQSWH